MKGKDLLNGMGLVDESFINEAETKKPNRITGLTWQKISAIAVCFVLVVFSSVLLRKDNAHSIVPPEDITSTPPQDITSETQTDRYALHLNPATESMMAKRIRITGHFWQTLSEKETEGIFHQAANDYNIAATANFSKTDTGISLYDVNATVTTTENLTAKVIVSPNKIAKCYAIEGEPVLSQLNGISIDAGYFDKTNDGTIIYYADFEIDGVYYYVEMTGGKAEMAALPALIDAIIVGGKADFSAITPAPPAELREDTLTLEEGYQDKDFGSFIPQKFPDGYSLNSVYRLINQTSNSLALSLSKGMDSISWHISFAKEIDMQRFTSTKDTTNYDLALYPIPHADSVPIELREIVDNPVFAIDDLTLETVKMRRYTLNDAGDSNGERMRFSVLYDDVLVEVSTKGISSTALYEMLCSLK